MIIVKTTLRRCRKSPRCGCKNTPAAILENPGVVSNLSVYFSLVRVWIKCIYQLYSRPILCGPDLMKNLGFDYAHAVAMRHLPLPLLLLLPNSGPGCKRGDYLISKCW
jgi:hypothetical protein